MSTGTQGRAEPSDRDPKARVARWHRDLALVLRRYGFWGLDVDGGRGSLTGRLRVLQLPLEELELRGDAACVVFVAEADGADLPGVSCQAEPPRRLILVSEKRLLRRRQAVYHPLLPSVSFVGDGVVPIWQTPEGRAVLGWWQHEGRRHLLVGLQVADELVRYTQGDPSRVAYDGSRNLWGGRHEQPAYLYEGHVAAGHELEPWADRLGAALAELLARSSGLPLVSPLPGGAAGAVLLTGDDDEAWLEKYDEQLRLIGDFPITYLMLPHTRHTAETLARLPANVQFGVHVDALEQPDRYDAICARQTQEVRELLGGRPARVVRNHGHLNRGYWSQLSAWEASGLKLDLNVRGLDGTCPAGSYLPFRVRRPDGSWSGHISLFSTFSDSMLFLQKWAEGRQIKVITSLADRIDRTYPGILVFNFHPQNVSSVSRVHRAIVDIAARRGWIALGAEILLDWLERVDGVRLIAGPGGLGLTSPREVGGLCLRWPGGREVQALPRWQGECRLRPPEGRT